MLKQIVHPSQQLRIFLLSLGLTLSRPQFAHLWRLTDALITVDAKHKTLAALYRTIVDAPDASAAADFLRQSPWESETIQQAARVFVVQDMVAYAEQEGLEKIMFASLDDSLGKKDKATRSLEGVDWHHDHSQSTRQKPHYSKGTVHLELRLSIGTRSYAFDWRIYLRESTVRRLNRHKGKRLKYRSKYALAREMLEQLKALLPQGYQLYLLCDSWYASNKLIKYCLRQGWQLITAVRSNRSLNGKKLSNHNKLLKQQRYCRVAIAGRTYLVRQVTGKLKDVPAKVCILISKRHPRDQHPKYFMTTDLSLSPQQVLSCYSKRWPIEVDNFYLKQALGLCDFRVQRFEALKKWFALVFLALLYLQWRLHQEQGRRCQSLADVIGCHRQEHAHALLQAACQAAKRGHPLADILQRFSQPVTLA